MTPQEWLDATRSDGAQLLAIDLPEHEVRVPSCPDWTLPDLLTHIGYVYRWWAFVAELPEGERPTREKIVAAGIPAPGSIERPDGDLATWFGQSVDQFIDSYTRQPAAKTIHSSFWGPQPLSFLARRMAHETAIHRWDAQQAVGRPSGFDPVLAADGVDEFLEIWVPGRFRYGDFNGSGRVVELNATDCDSSWRIHVGGDTTRWERSGGPADVVAYAPAGDLYLFVWGRASVGHLEVEGDADLLSAWQAAAAV